MRQAREAPLDSESRAAAVTLARKLFRSEYDSSFQEMLHRNIVNVVPSSGSGVLESALDFTSYCAFCTHINYWAARVLLCGLILALADISPAMPYIYNFDTKAVATCDLQAANYQAMSLPFALRSTTRLPLNALRFIVPLELTFGAWHRLEARAGGPCAISPDAERGRSMKRWVQQWMASMAAKWCRPNAGPTATLDYYETRTEMLMGGSQSLSIWPQK